MNRAKDFIAMLDNYSFMYHTFGSGLKTHMDLKILETTKIFLACGEV